MTADSGLFLLEVRDVDEGTGAPTPRIDLRLVPLRVDGGVISVPGEEAAAAIREQVNAVSTGWRLDDDGRALPATDHTGSCRV